MLPSTCMYSYRSNAVDRSNAIYSYCLSRVRMMLWLHCANCETDLLNVCRLQSTAVAGWEIVWCCGCGTYLLTRALLRRSPGCCCHLQKTKMHEFCSKDQIPEIVKMLEHCDKAIAHLSKLADRESKVWSRCWRIRYCGSRRKYMSHLVYDLAPPYVCKLLTAC